MLLRLINLRRTHLFNLLVLVGLSSHLQRNWRTWIGFPIVTEQNIKVIHRAGELRPVGYLVTIPLKTEL